MALNVHFQVFVCTTTTSCFKMYSPYKTWHKPRLLIMSVSLLFFTMLRTWFGPNFIPVCATAVLARNDLFGQKKKKKKKKMKTQAKPKWYFFKVKCFWKLMICFSYFCTKIRFLFCARSILTFFLGASWAEKYQFLEILP